MKVKLNPEQEKAWQIEFEFALDDNNGDQEIADRVAWEELCKLYPELKQFDGILP
jgi:hypothetical protein